MPWAHKRLSSALKCGGNLNNTVNSFTQTLILLNSLSVVKIMNHKMVVYIHGARHVKPINIMLGLSGRGSLPQILMFSFVSIDELAFLTRKEL